MERIGGCAPTETELFSKWDVFIAQLFLNVLTWKAVNNAQLKEETVHHPLLMCRKKCLCVHPCLHGPASGRRTNSVYLRERGRKMPALGRVSITFMRM